MTVIALFSELDVAIADILLTYDGAGPWPSLPTVADPGPIAGDYPCHFSRLARKSSYVTQGGRTVLFLVAGDISHVDAYLREVNSLAIGTSHIPAHLGRINRQDLDSVLNGALDVANQKGKHDVGFIGIRGERFFAAAQTVDNIPYFGEVSISGTGAPLLLNLLTDSGKNYNKKYPNDTIEQKFMRIINNVSMNLIQADRHRPSLTLSEGVRGFYEIYYNLKGELTPLGASGWTRTISTLKKRAEHGICLDALWYHYYEKQNLYILSASALKLALPQNVQKILPWELFRVDVVGPYGSPKQASEFQTTVSLKQKELGSRLARSAQYTSQLSGGPLGLSSLIYGTTKAQRLLDLSATENGLAVTLRSESFLPIWSAAARR